MGPKSTLRLILGVFYPMLLGGRIASVMNVPQKEKKKIKSSIKDWRKAKEKEKFSIKDRKRAKEKYTERSLDQTMSE